MKTPFQFRLQEFSSGALISLPDLVKLLPVSKVKSWRFHQVQLCFGAPLGIPCETFDRIMRSPSGSITLPDEMFREFLSEDRQFIDGYIDAFEEDAVDPLFTIEAVDASYWLIHTYSRSVAQHLSKSGFDQLE